MGATQTRYAFRVISIHENSPVLQCDPPIVPYFDFIVQANDVDLTFTKADVESSMEVYQKFLRILNEFENKTLSLTLFNCKCKQTIKHSFVPKSYWGGPGLLGMTIKFGPLDYAPECILHVVSVSPDSPAQKANLQPSFDYIVGFPDFKVGTVDEFFRVVAEVTGSNKTGLHMNLRLFVYNTKQDIIRVVTITPDYSRDNNDFIGCELGTGESHQLPEDARITRGKPCFSDYIKAHGGSDDGNVGALSSEEHVDEQQPSCPRETRVSIESLGEGKLCGKRGGISVVELDWGLQNGATAISFTRNVGTIHGDAVVDKMEGVE